MLTLSKSKLFNGIKKRLILWFLAFVASFFFQYLIDPFIYREYINSLALFVEDTLWILLFSILIAEISILIDYYLEKKMSWNSNQGIKRLIVQGAIQIVSSIVIVISINYFFFSDSYSLNSSTFREEITFLGQWVATSIIVSLFISAFNTSYFLLMKWKKTAIEATQQKLKASEHRRAAMSAELQALKLQIDPHFIFNNLSVLSELILEDQQLGYEYSESFAKVYRYLLINSSKDHITLEDELKFLDSYIFLTQKRIGEGVIFNISIDENYKKFLLPPLSLQFLVENALKHNQTSKLNPLEIRISTSNDGHLIVHNTLIPLLNKRAASGIGIKNLLNRFEYLGNKRPIIVKTDKDFIAKIPLYDNK